MKTLLNNTPGCWIRRLNLVKLPILFNCIYILNEITVKIQKYFGVDFPNYPKMNLDEISVRMP